MKQAIFQLTVKTLETSNAIKQDPKTLQNEQSAQTRLKEPWNKHCAQPSLKYPMKKATCSNKAYIPHQTSNALQQDQKTL